MLDKIQQINTHPCNQIDFYALDCVVSDFFKQFESQLERIENVITTELGVDKINVFIDQAKCKVDNLTDTLIQELHHEEQELRAGIVPSHIQALKNECDEAITNLESLTKEKQNLEEQLQEALEPKERFTEHFQRLEYQVSAKEAEIRVLETKVAALQKALEQSQVEIATQYTQARTLEKELRAEIEASQREAAARYTNGLRQELETAQAKQVQAERGQLEQQFRKRESALRHTISTLQARLDQSSQEIASLQRQMQAAQADKQTAELALHNLQQRRQELEQHDNALLRAQLTRLESKNQTQAAQVKALQDQLTTLIAAKQHVEATVQQLHTQVNQAQSERVQLQNRLSEFERLEDDHQAARAKASRDIERLETELAESKARLATAVNQRSIQQWLSEVRTQMQARGVKRWLVRAAVAVAVFCVSWISQVM
ncbi:MAG: hypothetical protein HC926_02760 [Synechococcaceae cyanobacterium SM2_3_60]|nr:hypothetical protein [Synechococcaceae cyanobacterium SM2_3_60]